ncbi:hypothetical protein GJU40_05505 [Bacillus lacus]|uniref:Adenylyltransferase AadA C-terminal domain-containing protein n=1 Tax=Metabacillus lacus TaxID=1983721 RepID=A0A7X2LXT3_9BACI|nr:hypothetical protein [Metabacillus lacus]MRX71631.1 hypothetical protein [Metabacillus lacus]
MADTNVSALSAEIRYFLNSYCKSVQKTLETPAKSILLSGSLPLQCYDDEKSDIDIAVLLEKPLTRVEISRLKKLHEQMDRTVNYRMDILFLLKIKSEIYNCIQFQYSSGNISCERKELRIFEWLTICHNHILMTGEIVDVDSSNTVLLKDFAGRELNRQLKKYSEASIRNSDFFFSESISQLARTLYTMETGKIESKLRACLWLCDREPAWKKTVLEAIRLREGSIKKSFYSSTLQWKKDIFQFYHDILAKLNHRESC